MKIVYNEIGDGLSVPVLKNARKLEKGALLSAHMCKLQRRHQGPAPKKQRKKGA